MAARGSITVNVKGNPITFFSNMDDNQALAAIKGLILPGGLLANSTFAKDLVLKGAQYGLSPAQKNWVHKLVIDALNPTAKPDAPKGNFLGVISLFNKAKASLKMPKITLMVDGKTVRLGMTGPTSRYPGCVNVTDGTGYGGTWYGRVNADGSFTTSNYIIPAVTKLLEELAVNPVKVATEYGKLTGCCCFCGKGLKDDKSVDVGYGPICAERYELPWGTKPAVAPVKKLAPQEGEEVEENGPTPGSPEWVAEMEANDMDTPPGVGAGVGGYSCN